MSGGVRLRHCEGREWNNYYRPVVVAGACIMVHCSTYGLFAGRPTTFITGLSTVAKTTNN